MALWVEGIAVSQQAVQAVIMSDIANYTDVQPIVQISAVKM